MNKGLSIFGFILFLFLCASNVSAAVLGDINGDDEVGLEETVYALHIMVGNDPSAPVYKEANINGDGRIGIEELIYALQITAGLKQPPALGAVDISTWDSGVVFGH